MWIIFFCACICHIQHTYCHVYYNIILTCGIKVIGVGFRIGSGVDINWGCCDGTAIICDDGMDCATDTLIGVCCAVNWIFWPVTPEYLWKWKWTRKNCLNFVLFFSSFFVFFSFFFVFIKIVLWRKFTCHNHIIGIGLLRIWWLKCSSCGCSQLLEICTTKLIELIETSNILLKLRQLWYELSI